MPPDHRLSLGTVSEPMRSAVRKCLGTHATGPSVKFGRNFEQEMSGVHGERNGWMNEWMNACMHGWMDEWMNAISFHQDIARCKLIIWYWNNRWNDEEIASLSESKVFLFASLFGGHQRSQIDSITFWSCYWCGFSMCPSEVNECMSKILEDWKVRWLDRKAFMSFMSSWSFTSWCPWWIMSNNLRKWR